MDRQNVKALKWSQLITAPLFPYDQYLDLFIDGILVCICLMLMEMKFFLKNFNEETCTMTPTCFMQTHAHSLHYLGCHPSHLKLTIFSTCMLM